MVLEGERFGFRIKTFEIGVVRQRVRALGVFHQISQEFDYVERKVGVVKKD